MNVDAVLDYLVTFVGTPYKWHRAGDAIGPAAPFWVEDAPPITRADIDAHGGSIVCAGLINLARRFVGRPIPGLAAGDPFAGTTGAWFSSLERAGLLHPFEPTRRYPKGTLLLRDFADIEHDQGHVAVVADDACSSIIHSYADVDYSAEEGHAAGETGITQLAVFEGSPYYTHISYAQDWLTAAL